MGFERIFYFTLKWEGGSKITNDPDDPGKTTRWGLSQVANPDLDIINLTEDQAKDIYRERYWNPISKGRDDILDMAAFDTAVNVGVRRVNLWLMTAYTPAALLDLRRRHYAKIITTNNVLAKYQKGWENRVVALEKFLVEDKNG